MSHQTAYTRQDLARLSGVPDVVLSFWLKRRLLQPISGGHGRGSHRQFDAAQVNLACFLRQARMAGLNVSVLRDLADDCQAAITFWKNIDLPDRWKYLVVERFASDTPGDVPELRTQMDNGLPLEAAQYAIDSARSHGSDDFDRFWRAQYLIKGLSSEPWWAWRDVGGRWHLNLDDQKPRLIEQPAFFVVFDMDRQFALTETGSVAVSKKAAEEVE